MGESIASWIEANHFPLSLIAELKEFGIENVSDFSRMNSKALIITLEAYILKLPSFDNFALQISFKAAVLELIKKSQESLTKVFIH